MLGPSSFRSRKAKTAGAQNAALSNAVSFLQSEVACLLAAFKREKAEEKIEVSCSSTFILAAGKHTLTLV